MHSANMTQKGISVRSSAQHSRFLNTVETHTRRPSQSFLSLLVILRRQVLPKRHQYRERVPHPHNTLVTESDYISVSMKGRPQECQLIQLSSIKSHMFAKIYK